jgi:hypothetical protein
VKRRALRLIGQHGDELEWFDPEPPTGFPELRTAYVVFEGNEAVAITASLQDDSERVFFDGDPEARSIFSQEYERDIGKRRHAQQDSAVSNE